MSSCTVLAIYIDCACRLQNQENHPKLLENFEMDRVPDLPTKKIFSYLDFDSLKSCRIVFKSWYVILKRKYVWQKLLQEQRLNLVQGPDIHVYSLYFQETDALFELADMHKNNHSTVEWEPAFGCSRCADCMKEKIVAAKNSWLCLIDHVGKGDSTKDMIILIPKISQFLHYGCLKTPKLVEEKFHQEYSRLYKLVVKFNHVFQLPLEIFLRSAILSKNIPMVKFLQSKVEIVDYVHKNFQDSYLTMAASSGSLEIFILVREWIQERKGNIFF